MLEYRGANIVHQLTTWSLAENAGPVFDSSAGFRLPDGSVLSPDASWVHRDRWMALTIEG